MELYEQTKLIVDYLIKNKDAFTEFERDTIIRHIGSVEKGYSLPSVVSQIYDELNILPEDKNIYKSFLGLLDEEFNIKDKNIIEIGGGNIPRLGIRIATMQDKGTITVYDPNLYMKDYNLDNLKLVKRRFYAVDDVEDTDILVGLMPCGATEKIIKSAILHDKDFMIALCDHYNSSWHFDECDEDLDWRESLIDGLRDEVEENHMGILKVKKLDVIGDHPIIYNCRG